jgi:hypothetical protein
VKAVAAQEVDVVVGDRRQPGARLVGDREALPAQPGDGGIEGVAAFLEVADVLDVAAVGLVDVDELEDVLPVAADLLKVDLAE